MESVCWDVIVWITVDVLWETFSGAGWWGGEKTAHKRRKSQLRYSPEAT